MGVRVFYDGRIIGQREINDLVRQARDAERGVTLAEGDILVIRKQGASTVYRECYTEWDPQLQEAEVA